MSTFSMVLRKKTKQSYYSDFIGEIDIKEDLSEEEEQEEEEEEEESAEREDKQCGAGKEEWEPFIVRDSSEVAFTKERVKIRNCTGNGFFYLKMETIHDEEKAKKIYKKISVEKECQYKNYKECKRTKIHL